MSAVLNGAITEREYRRVKISGVVSSRYCSMERPDSWDSRVAGVDVVTADDGEILKLNSSAMQSTPKPGWVIMLTGGTSEEGYAWTLYGMPRN